MGILGYPVASRIDLQTPFNAIDFEGIGVDDSLWKQGVILENVIELAILGYQFVSA
jgi:hypothetical protein